MSDSFKTITQLIFGLVCVFPLLFDVLLVPLLQLPTRLVVALKHAPFFFSGEFTMLMSLLLFIVGAGFCYMALQKLVY